MEMATAGASNPCASSPPPIAARERLLGPQALPRREPPSRCHGQTHKDTPRNAHLSRQAPRHPRAPRPPPTPGGSAPSPGYRPRAAVATWTARPAPLPAGDSLAGGPTPAPRSARPSAGRGSLSVPPLRVPAAQPRRGEHAGLAAPLSPLLRSLRSARPAARLQPSLTHGAGGRRHLPASSRPQGGGRARPREAGPWGATEPAWGGGLAGMGPPTVPPGVPTLSLPCLPAPPSCRAPSLSGHCLSRRKTLHPAAGPLVPAQRPDGWLSPFPSAAPSPTARSLLSPRLSPCPSSRTSAGLAGPPPCPEPRDPHLHSSPARPQMEPLSEPRPHTPLCTVRPLAEALAPEALKSSGRWTLVASKRPHPF